VRLSVDTKSVVDDVFGNDVDTKHLASATIGNDESSVDTKSRDVGAFGNYGLGFVRVRKRELKGGHPSSRYWRTEAGLAATESKSFDVVRAVRVDGKPRHQFVFGLGSQKDQESDGGIAYFWLRALYRMQRNGLNAEQRRALTKEMLRKGAEPTTPDIFRQRFGSNGYVKEVDKTEVISWFDESGGERVAA
jgi:hypothetical protein